MEAAGLGVGLAVTLDVPVADDVALEVEVALEVLVALEVDEDVEVADAVEVADPVEVAVDVAAKATNDMHEGGIGLESSDSSQASVDNTRLRWSRERP